MHRSHAQAQLMSEGRAVVKGDEGRGDDAAGRPAGGRSESQHQMPLAPVLCCRCLRGALQSLCSSMMGRRRNRAW